MYIVWVIWDPNGKDIKIFGSTVVCAVQQRSHAATLGHPARPTQLLKHSTLAVPAVLAILISLRIPGNYHSCPFVSSSYIALLHVPSSWFLVFLSGQLVSTSVLDDNQFNLFKVKTSNNFFGNWLSEVLINRNMFNGFNSIRKQFHKNCMDAVGMPQSTTVRPRHFGELSASCCTASWSQIRSRIRDPVTVKELEPKTRSRQVILVKIDCNFLRLKAAWLHVNVPSLNAEACLLWNSYVALPHAQPPGRRHFSNFVVKVACKLYGTRLKHLVAAQTSCVH